MSVRNPWAAGAVLCALAQIVGCSDGDSLASRLKPPTADSPTVATPPPSPLLRTIGLNGNTRLNAIGETTQLAVIATYTDNSTKDITAESTFTVSDTRVVTISPNGTATALAFGVTTVSVRYQTRGLGSTLIVSPAGTFFFSGRTREPGQSGLGGVMVRELSSGRTATANEDGIFSFANLPMGLPYRLRGEREGYEPAEVAMGTGAFADLPLQRVIRVEAGQTVTPSPLAPNDLSYDVAGRRCFPCRMVRLMMPGEGTAIVRVASTSPLRWMLFALSNVFGDAQTTALTAEIPTDRSGETIVYVGVEPTTSVNSHITFTINAALK